MRNFRTKERTLKPLVRILLACVLAASAPETADAATQRWNDLGLRTAFQAGTKREYFHQYEIFFNYGIPLEWRHDSGWGLGTRFECALGALHGDGDTGAIGSGGPGISFNRNGTGPSLDLGINLDLLEKRTYGTQNFGSHVQFGAYAGASWRLSNGIRAEYRLHHISNGHLLTPHVGNPGLDMHMFGLSWGF